MKRDVERRDAGFSDVERYGRSLSQVVSEACIRVDSMCCVLGGVANGMCLSQLKLVHVLQDLHKWNFDFCSNNVMSILNCIIVLSVPKSI